MSGFVIFALVLTFVYVVYFAVMITLDLHGKKDEKKTEEEKKWIRRFFNFRQSNLELLESKKIILFTQPLSEDKVMTEEEKIELLASDGMLIKRPLIIINDKILIGFKEQEWKEYFNK